MKGEGRNKGGCCGEGMIHGYKGYMGGYGLKMNENWRRKKMKWDSTGGVYVT